MFSLFTQKLGAGIVSLALAFSSLLGYTPQPAPKLAGAAPQFVAAKPAYLFGAGISSSDTTIKLTSLVTPNGTPITSDQLIGGAGDYFYLTLEPASSKKEFTKCNSVTQNTNGTAVVGGCVRGLQFTTPYTASTTLALSHSGGGTVVISNAPQLYQDILNYINLSLQAGVNNASLIAKGILQVATGAQAGSTTPIGGGSTDAALALTTTIASSTWNGASLSSNIIPVTKPSTGKLDSGFISTSTLYVAAPGLGLATSTYIGSFPAYQIGKNALIDTTTGTTTFLVPSGIRTVNVVAIGSGSSGQDVSACGGSSNAGTGGAAGAYVSANIDVTSTSSIQMYVDTLNNGKFTFFGTNGYFITAGSGAKNLTTGGTGAISGGGAASTTSSVIVNGQNGVAGFANTTIIGVGGMGASTPLGVGGGFASNVAGDVGTGYGSGGAGGGCANSGAAHAGGAGTQGIIIVRW